MKKDRLYIFFLALLFGLFLLVKLTERQPLNWILTLDYTSKEPYGTAALHSLLPDMFSEVRMEGKTLYEQQDVVEPGDNVLILAKKFEPGAEDINTLLTMAYRGNNVFISAEDLGKELQDTLHINASNNFFDFASFRESDSLFIKFNFTARSANESLTKEYYFRTINQSKYINRFPPDSASVLTVNQESEINTIRMPFGKGQIFINTTPAVFTNIYVAGPNQEFVSTLLSVMPPSRIIWFENYQVGNRELRTPLRYILTTEPLAWAYYLTIGAILLFMLFEVRRKQRAIPIIKPLTNQSLEFAGTISALYFQRGDHKNMAEKRIHYFYDYVRTHYYLSCHEPDFVEKLSLKALKPLHQMEALVNTLTACQQAKQITINQLTDLNQRIEDFYRPIQTNKN